VRHDDESGRVCVGSRVEPISLSDTGKVAGERENATPSAGGQVACGEAKGGEQQTQIVPPACGPRSVVCKSVHRWIRGLSQQSFPIRCCMTLGSISTVKGNHYLSCRNHRLGCMAKTVKKAIVP